MACMPGICGMMVVSRAMMVRPSGLRLRKADTIMRTNLFCGSTSMAAELTLSGSTRTLLEVRRIVVGASFRVKSSAAQKTEILRGLTQVLAKSGLKTNTQSEAKKINFFLPLKFLQSQALKPTQNLRQRRLRFLCSNNDINRVRLLPEGTSVCHADELHLKGIGWTR